MTTITVADVAEILSILADNGNGWKMDGFHHYVGDRTACIRSYDGRWDWKVYEGSGDNFSLLVSGSAASVHEARQAADAILFDRELPF